MFIKKKSTRRLARKHEVLLSLASRLITLVTPDFFDRKVSSCFIQGQKPAQTFNPTWYSRGWRGSGLPDLFAVGTSAGGISPTYQVTHLLGGRMKVPHLMWIRPMKCWLATLNVSSAIVSHALEQINAAWTGVICLSASSKLSASCLHDSIDVYTATRARSSRKVQEDKWRSLCVVCGLLAMLRNRK